MQRQARVDASPPFARCDVLADGRGAALLVCAVSMSVTELEEGFWADTGDVRQGSRKFRAVGRRRGTVTSSHMQVASLSHCTDLTRSAQQCVTRC